MPPVLAGSWRNLRHPDLADMVAASTKAGAFVSDIFREIEEELRRDNLLKLWARYRWYIVGVVCVALLIAGGIVAWRDYQVSQRRAEAARYTGAQSLARTGKEGDAAKLFAGLAQAGGGYGVLAAFEQAELMARTGDRKGAVEAYDKIAASSGLDRELRDLATLLSVMQGMPDMDPKAAVDRLQPLLAQANPWRATALELTAAAKLKGGDRGGAAEVYKQLADDTSTPQQLRARAAEMTAALAP